MKVLLAEDDAHIREGLAEVLAKEGFHPILAADGQQALDLFERESPDFVCLDIMMPKIDGYALCRELRRRRPDAPIIFISAKSEEIDKVLGLELGADDYISKPFGAREVAARIRAVARRCLARGASSPGYPTAPFVMDDLTVVPAELRARRNGEDIDLSLRDVKVLSVLFQRKGQAVDRYTLFSEVWGVDHVPNSRTLDQHISQLRKRIEADAKNPRIIRTVHGVGYRYEDSTELNG